MKNWKLYGVILFLFLSFTIAVFCAGRFYERKNLPPAAPAETVRVQLPAPPPIKVYIKGKEIIKEIIKIDSTGIQNLRLRNDSLSRLQSDTLAEAYETEYEDSLHTIKVYSYPMFRANVLDIIHKPQKPIEIPLKPVPVPQIIETGATVWEVAIITTVTLLVGYAGGKIL